MPWKLLLALALLALVLAASGELGPLMDGLPDLAAAKAQLGPASAPAAILVAALAVMVLVPTAPIAMAAGATFGPFAGFLWSLLGAGLGTWIAFQIGSRLAAAPVARLTRSRPRLATLCRMVERGGWKGVALAHLSPLLPFSIGNYLLATTGITARDYTLASLLGSIPSHAVYAYLGALGSGLLLSATPPDTSWLEASLLIVGGIATVLLAITFRKHAAATASP